MENTKCSAEGVVASYTAEAIVKAYDVCREMESLMSKFNPTAKSVTCEIGNGIIHAMILDSDWKCQFSCKASIDEPSKMFAAWDNFLTKTREEKAARIAELEEELKQLKSE